MLIISHAVIRTSSAHRLIVIEKKNSEAGIVSRKALNEGLGHGSVGKVLVMQE